MPGDPVSIVEARTAANTCDALRDGTAALAANDPAAALACFEQATAAMPGDRRAWLGLARAHLAVNCGDAAMAAMRAAAASAEPSAARLLELAELCREHRLWDEAETWCHAALAEDAGCGEAWLCLARIALVRADPDGAIYALRRSGSASFIAHASYAEAFRALGKLNDAALHYAEAARVASSVEEHLFNLARMHAAMGEWGPAEARLREVVARRPGSAVAHHTLARILMLTGQVEEGLRENEWRPGRAELESAFRTARYWDGAARPGDTVLVSGEGGDGDIIHYARYVPHLKGLFGSVLLDVPARLKRLLEQAPAFAGIEIGSGFVLPALRKPQHKVTTSSLEHLLFGRTAAAPIPYLQAAAPETERWRSALARHGGKRVGLVWAGSDRGRRGDRSIPPPLLGELLAIPGVTFVSLQLGDDSLAGRALAVRMVDAAPALRDWTDTAAAVMALDLVISVDTAVAHLAGALDKAVWCLLPTPPDCRWRLAGSTTELYPSMRLFRQAATGGWDDVVGRVKRALLDHRFA